MSSWVATQPPPGAGWFCTAMTRPSEAGDGVEWLAGSSWARRSANSNRRRRRNFRPRCAAAGCRRSGQPGTISAGKVVHLEIALVADDQPPVGVEHAQALRHVVQGGVEPILRRLQLARALGEPRLGDDQPAQLLRPAAQQKARTADDQQRPGADRQHAPVPARQDRGFQQRDVDGERVALQRPHRDEPDALPELAGGAKMAAAVPDGFVELRAGGELRARVADRLRIAPEQRPVVAHQQKSLAAHRADGFIDVGEVFDLHADRDDAGKFAIPRVDASC